MREELHHLNTIKRCKPMLGTYVEVCIEADTDDDSLIQMSDLVYSKMHKIESLMSFYNPKSELSYINYTASKKPCSISKEMHEVLSLALRLSRVTDGMYDISVAKDLIKYGLLPGNNAYLDDDANWRDIYLEDGMVSFQKDLMIDLGGIAKGYAVDYAFAAIENDVFDITINAGGDIRKKRWQDSAIAIKASNRKGKRQLVSTMMRSGSVATSASYYIDDAHAAIFSPKTHGPIEDKRSISVFAPSCMLADSLTKVAFLSDVSVINALGGTAMVMADNTTLTTLH